jgi:hypothetical protein
MSTSGIINPVANIRRLHCLGADIDVLLGAMNVHYAVTKYGSKTVVASIVGNDVEFMSDRTSKRCCNVASKRNQEARRNH